MIVIMGMRFGILHDVKNSMHIYHLRLFERFFSFARKAPNCERCRSRR